MNENYNATIHFLTGNDELDIQLLDIEISTAYLDILSTILGIISAIKAKQLLLEKIMQQQNCQSQQNSQNQQSEQNKQQPNTSHPTPSEIAAFASCLGIYVIFTYTKVSFIRLREVYNNIQANTTNFTITPNVNIITGFVYSCIGTLLRTIGALQRVNEEAQITVL
ncbi:hypothetical protein [Clostridium beijerinckii]|uniref:Uncharacterized protein n=1 Tax=Clostridium beijerinckii TaxID=1520 RepID=A0A1S9N519_CLOBE|nr:hypothetical protein [Clostridium beijerinckii]MZK51115.1 hypothetical protein [Clostridium beijerinckii]MZK59317.1 hypothetical protein [Clostridium beijerinckii]MZK69436.1 hypothetical protein [Clostridium beijerinckii]MZK74809.1 hypothetical protein [Clostridium beijerinckii]MZK84527.1 hypothetical protein [Clostridium beijerinckii]